MTALDSPGQYHSKIQVLLLFLFLAAFHLSGLAGHTSQFVNGMYQFEG